MTIKEWLEKADWEGGILEALNYGLTSDDLDDNTRSTEFYSRLKAIEHHYRSLRPHLNWIEEEYDV